MIKRLILLAAFSVAGRPALAAETGHHATAVHDGATTTAVHDATTTTGAPKAAAATGSTNAQDNAHAGAEQFRTREEEVRVSMINMSRQLNVTCTTCHNPKNFASNEKEGFKTGKEHMRLTQLLIDQGFDGLEKRPKADCYMCHRGKLKPDFLEPIDPLIQDKTKAKAH